MSFSSFGEPQKVFINQTATSSSNGSFTLKVGSGNCDTLYTLAVVAYRASSWNAYETGPSLPPLPKTALTSFFDNTTLYLQPAATLNLTAVNSTHNISFNYVIFDDSLGFPVAENFQTQVWNASVVVPQNKNFTIMMMRTPQFGPGVQDPFATALPPQTIVVQNASNYSDTEFVLNFNKNLSFSMFNITGNVSVEGNTTPINLTQILVKLGIAGLVPPNSDVQIPGGSIITPNSGGGSQNLANYTITVMGSAGGIYQILEFYGANSSAMSSGAGEYSAYFSNFTVTGNMTHHVTLKKLAGNYSTVTGITSLNTSYVTVNISDSSGLPLDDAHVEIKVDMVGHRSVFPTFRYMADQLSGGLIRLPIINDSNATVLVFNRRFAPLKFKLNVTNASRESNGIIQLTLNAFKPRKFHANGSSEDFSGTKAGQYRMTFLRNTAACNVFNASLESCRLFPNDFDAGSFNPLKVMATGKVNMLMEINTTGVKIYFLGVDMLASGPPEASMSENAMRSNRNVSNYEEIFKFGSAAPNIYDKVFVGIPYNHSLVNDAAQMNFTIKGLFDDNGIMVWNGTSTPNSSIPSEWSDYDTRWFNTTSGGMICSNTEDANSTNATCFINRTTNYVWISLPHFSDGEGGPQGEPDTSPPAAPGGVNVSATLGGTVMVNWTQVSNETGESYIVYRASFDISQVAGNLSNYSGLNSPINITNLTSVRIPEGVSSFVDNLTLNGTVYYYAVAAVDSAGNLQNSTFGINISNSINATANDTIVPSIPTNLNLTTSGSSSITVTISWANVTRDAAGYADFHGLVYKVYRSNSTVITLSSGNITAAANLTNVKNQTSPANSTTDTLTSNGTFQYIVTTLDDAGHENISIAIGAGGNQGNVTVAITGSGSSTTTSGGSGGGGGGGGGTPVPSTGVKVSKKWAELPAGTATMKIANDKIGIKVLDFTVANAASNVEIAVTKLDEKPATKREVQGKVYQYIKIDKTGLRDADVPEAKVEFSVEKKWFDQNQGSVKDIVLQRYFNEMWTSLDTAFKRSDTTHNYFEATSPGLSLFAIVLKPKAAVEEKPKADETPVNISASPSANESKGNETGEGAGKGAGGSKAMLFILIGLVVAAAIGGGAFLIMKKGGGGGLGSLKSGFTSLFRKFGKGRRRSSSSKLSDEEEAAEIVRDYESQKSQQAGQQPRDQRGRPPEAFN